MPARGPDENLRPLNLIEPTGPSRDRELFTGVARWNDSSSIGERKRGEGGLGRVFDGGGTDYFPSFLVSYAIFISIIIFSLSVIISKFISLLLDHLNN